MGLLVVNSDPERLWGKPLEPTREELSKMYFTIEALEDCSVNLIIPASVSAYQLTSVSYSIDNGETWITTENINSTEVSISVDNVNKGDKILWKGLGTTFINSNNYTRLYSSGYINILGNIMSLLYGDEFAEVTSLSGSFRKLFSSDESITSKIVDASDLILPATILTEGCYQQMFYGCTSLTTAPELPATSLQKYCYEEMFRGCTSLTTAPELPATTLKDSCYYGMFNRCTSLTTAPELPASTIVRYCYYTMFYGCTSLSYIKMLATTSISSSNMDMWVKDVSPTGTFVKAAGVELPSGISGIPSGWTVEEV